MSSFKDTTMHGLCTVSVILLLIAITTNSWSTKTLTIPGSTNNTDVSIGLWKTCGEISGNMQGISGDAVVCTHVPVDGWKTFPKNSLYAVRVLSILGVVLIFLSVICNMYRSGSHFCHLGMLLFGGICAIVANIVWAAELLKVKLADSSPTITFKPGYSFYLNLVGGIFAIISAIYLHYTTMTPYLMM